jgi:hypothetical protein
VIHRKNRHLKCFDQERDVLSIVTDNEIRALEDALLLAQLLFRPESARQANNMLNETDHRNTIHLTLRSSRVGRANMAVNRKRKHVDDDSTDSEVGGTEQNPIAHRVRRRRMNQVLSNLSKMVNRLGQH